MRLPSHAQQHNTFLLHPYLRLFIHAGLSPDHPGGQAGCISAAAGLGPKSRVLGVSNGTWGALATAALEAGGSGGGHGGTINGMAPEAASAAEGGGKAEVAADGGKGLAGEAAWAPTGGGKGGGSGGFLGESSGGSADGGRVGGGGGSLDPAAVREAGVGNAAAAMPAARQVGSSWGHILSTSVSTGMTVTMLSPLKNTWCRRRCRRSAFRFHLNLLTCFSVITICCSCCPVGETNYTQQQHALGW